MNRKSNGNAQTVLSTRALNRSLLARQQLLKRKKVPAIEMIEHLVGMQSQLPNSPYVGLWTRLVKFRHSELADLYHARQVVRLAMMRSTIHLVSSADCLSLRPLVQPAIERGFGTWSKTLPKNLQKDIEEAGRALVEASPATFSEIARSLGEKWPDRNADGMSHAIRTRVPLVQVTPRGIWGHSSQASHTSAESWLGQPLNDNATVASLMIRYLAAFGPASVMDAQAWSGLSRLATVFEELRPALVTFRDDKDRELFDLPDAPRPRATTKAPVRFLPEFDNVLLAYKDRRRIIADEYKSRVYPNNGMIQPTVLVDGFVEGKWKVVSNDQKATLEIEAFRRFTKSETAAIEDEGKSVIEFVAGKRVGREIRITGSA